MENAREPTHYSENQAFILLALTQIRPQSNKIIDEGKKFTEIFKPTKEKGKKHRKH